MSEPKLVEFHLTGNIIPPIWYKKITFENGKPQLLAINILSDIVYWYRPIEIRDEHTGHIIEKRKKFKADLLQRSYKQICDFFGCSEKQARESLILLEKLGLVERVFKPVKIGDYTVPKCMYLKLNINSLKKMSFINAEEIIENTKNTDNI